MNGIIEPIPEQPVSLGDRYFFCGELTEWDWRQIPHPNPNALPQGMVTPRQRECFEFIRRYTRDNGYPPTYREIASALGFTSTNYAHFLVHALEARGMIEIPRGGKGWGFPRSIEVMEGR